MPSVCLWQHLQVARQAQHGFMHPNVLLLLLLASCRSAAQCRLSLQWQLGRRCCLLRRRLGWMRCHRCLWRCARGGAGIWFDGSKLRLCLDDCGSAVCLFNVACTAGRVISLGQSYESAWPLRLTENRRWEACCQCTACDHSTALSIHKAHVHATRSNHMCTCTRTPARNLYSPCLLHYNTATQARTHTHTHTHTHDHFADFTTHQNPPTNAHTRAPPLFHFACFTTPHPTPRSCLLWAPATRRCTTSSKAAAA